MASDFTIDDKTIKLLRTISELTDTEEDKSIFKLHVQDPDKLKEVLISQLKGDNKQVIKESIEKILAKRRIINENGQESVDILGKKGNGFSHITEFNSEEVKKEFDAFRERAAYIKNELKALGALIENKIVRNNPSQFDVTVDTRKNLNLKGAIKRVFGSKTTTITFDMYKQALELRNRFYKEDVAATTEDQIKL